MCESTSIMKCIYSYYFSCVYRYTYSTEYAAVVNSEYCHHSSVTSLSWRHGTMATGSWDSTVKVYTSHNNKIIIYIYCTQIMCVCVCACVCVRVCVFLLRSGLCPMTPLVTSQSQQNCRLSFLCRHISSLHLLYTCMYTVSLIDVSTHLCMYKLRLY